MEEITIDIDNLEAPHIEVSFLFNDAMLKFTIPAKYVGKPMTVLNDGSLLIEKEVIKPIKP